MGNLTKILYGSIQSSVFRPGFARALFAKPFQEAASATDQVVRMSGLHLPHSREKVAHCSFERSLFEVINGIRMSEVHAKLQLPVGIDGSPSYPRTA